MNANLFLTVPYMNLNLYIERYDHNAYIFDAYKDDKEIFVHIGYWFIIVGREKIIDGNKIENKCTDEMRS